MNAKNESEIKFPKIVDLAEWQKARDAILVKEKAATRARDALAAERRRLPMVKIEKKYLFDGPNGKVTLLDLFEGRRQLILYHFMFAPPVGGWPDAGCVGCSMVTDQFGHTAHLHARDTSFCLVSLAPLKNIEYLQKTNGMDLSLVLLRRHRLQRRLRPHHRQRAKSSASAFSSTMTRMFTAPTSPRVAAPRD